MHSCTGPLILLSVLVVGFTFWESLTNIHQLPAASEQQQKLANAGQVLGSCVWAPQTNASHANTSCLEVVSERIIESYWDEIEQTDLPPLRWLFLGDSTMARLFRVSGLAESFLNASIIEKICYDEIKCYSRKTSRCNLNRDFGYRSPILASWKVPNVSLGEGPVKYGKQNTNCQDCSGCNSNFAFCSRQSNDTISTPNCVINKPPQCGSENNELLSYGGYFSIEFARDVEIQTSRFSTTQENIAEFLQLQ